MDVLHYLVNNVVVQYSADAEKGFRQPDRRGTLNHASQKAVEAYIARFHIILCLATEDVNIVQVTSRMVTGFLTGPKPKTRFLDLRHLLLGALFSDDGLTQQLLFDVTQRSFPSQCSTRKAPIRRNRVLRNRCCIRISNLETSTTSYRLLMFLKLFSSSSRLTGKLLTELREALFDSHEAPLRGVSVALFNAFASVDAGYSGHAVITIYIIRDPQDAGAGSGSCARGYKLQM